MEPVNLVLCEYLLEPLFWSYAILLEVITLDSEAVIREASAPIDARWIKVELFPLLCTHRILYLVYVHTLEDPKVINEIMEHFLQTVHLSRDFESKLGLFR